jgi:hypothetical protein
MATSLVKFSNQRMANGNGKDRLFWGRVEEDGLPYRGTSPPMMTGPEFEEALVANGDFHKRTFDLSLPDDSKAYDEIMDRVASGWYRLGPDPQGNNPKKFFTKVRYRDPQTGERRVRVLVQVYVEWYERFMQDGRVNNPENGSQ